MKTNQANKAHGPPGRVVGQGPTADVGNRRFTDAALLPPGNGRQFYYVHAKDDGTVDVYLRPDVHPMTDHNGCTDYDITAIVVRDVNPNDADFCGDLEGHIRAHYDAWCESGEEIYI